LGVPSASVRWVTYRVNPNGRMADTLLSGESCETDCCYSEELLTKDYSWEVLLIEMGILEIVIFRL